MEILVLNTNFEAIAVVDDYKSLIWSDRYKLCGDFELCLLMEKELLNILRQDYYLWIEESERYMIIEDISIDSDVEDGNHITVTGRSLESILDRRIIWGQKQAKGKIQEVIDTLLKESIIDPTIIERKIDNFIFEKSTDERITNLEVDSQFTGESLYTVIQNLCDKHKLGFKIILNDQNQFVFSLYYGDDRSYDQTINPYVIFSPDYENISNSNYFVSNSDYKNVTLVGGEGEGQYRIMVDLGNVSGLSRREIFTDASGISSNTSEHLLSEAEYLELLKNKGSEILLEHCNKTAFEGKIECTRPFKYGEDFFIGDIVQLTNEYGHEGKAYISEIVISQDEEGYSIYPTFETIDE